MPYVFALLFALAAMLAPAGARAEKRVALVIGNGAYQNTAPLNNPSNDASDVAAMLQRLGFEVVEGRDLDKRAMERLIRQFGTRLGGADVALFFYAGHGLQVGGQNFLVPTDARLAAEGDVDFESLPLNLVIKQMEREAKTSLVMLDACRDNPLSRNLARTMGTRSAAVGQGLAEVRTGVGTLIAFSTQPGYVALDGAGRNSPYTEAWLKYAEMPGKDISAVLVEVRNDVLKATGGRQVPWEHTSLTGQVYLRTLAAPTADETTKAPAERSYEKELEIAFWNSVKESKSPAVVQTYLDRYPGGTFAGLARVIVAQLQQPAAKPQEKREDSTKVAALPTPVPEAKPQPESQAGPAPEVLARALQTELKRVGCDPGSVDGKWGDRAKEALGDFARLAKVALPTEGPTAAALEAVTSRKQRVCPIECDKGEKEVDGRCVASRSLEKPRPARRPEREEAREARPRREAPAQSSKMCWTQDGRNFIAKPCN